MRLWFPGLTALLFGSGILVSDVAAQDGGFVRDRTATGCLFYSSGGEGWSNQWSYDCLPGQVIDGVGAMEGRRSENGIPVRVRFAGRLVGGYWHGRVNFELSLDHGDGRGFVVADEGETEFNMGCGPQQQGCRPGIVPSAAASPPRK